MAGQLIFLIGFMGAGKTTLGKAVSKRLNWPFIDLDKEIETAAGKPIPLIFGEEGESAFRELEAEVLQKTIDYTEPPAIIATGGGTPCFGHNMALMVASGLTIYLRPSFRKLLQRLTRQAKGRPLIAGLSPQNMREFVQTQLQEREKYYLKADYVVEDDRLKPEILADLILS